MSIEKITQQLKDLHSEIERLERLEADIMNEFYALYPCLGNNYNAVWIMYYGKEYVVTDIDFSIQTICLETSPYCDDNEVVNVGFELFDEILSEGYEIINI